MATVTIRPGDQVTKDPSGITSYVVDWDALNLAAGVTITASDWYVTAQRPNFTNVDLTADQAAVLSGTEATSVIGRTIPDDRVTRIQLSGGRMHQTYAVTNQIVTNETPTQTKHASFQVLIEQK